MGQYDFKEITWAFILARAFIKNWGPRAQLVMLGNISHSGTQNIGVAYDR